MVMGRGRMDHWQVGILHGVRGKHVDAIDGPSPLITFQILQSIAFACVVYFISSIPTLPFSIYSTFVLEEKHGFNKTTPSLFVTDLLKGWAIGFVIGAPFLAAFLYVFQWAGDRFVPWLMAFL